jgi:hypothetical protein
MSFIDGKYVEGEVPGVVAASELEHVIASTVEEIHAAHSSNNTDMARKAHDSAHALLSRVESLRGGCEVIGKILSPLRESVKNAYDLGSAAASPAVN